MPRAEPDLGHFHGGQGMPSAAMLRGLGFFGTCYVGLVEFKVWRLGLVGIYRVQGLHALIRAYRTLNLKSTLNP